MNEAERANVNHIAKWDTTSWDNIYNWDGDITIKGDFIKSENGDDEMTELSFMGRLIKAMATAKRERAGMELSYFDVVELLGELGSLKLYIDELESELATSKQKLTDCEAKIADRDKALNDVVHELSRVEIDRDELLKEMQWRLENKNNRIAYLKRRLELAEKERDVTDETVPEKFEENVAELQKMMSARFKDEDPEEFFRNLRE